MIGDMHLEEIFENLHQLLIPSTLWGVHLDVDECTAGILRMDVSNKEVLTDRAVLVYEDKSLGIISSTTIVDGKDITLPNINYVIEDLTDIQFLVSKLDVLKKCMNFENCKEYVENTEDNICSCCCKVENEDVVNGEENKEIIEDVYGGVEVITAQVYCNDCKKMFKNQNTFTEHLDRCPKKSKRFTPMTTCEICFKSFTKTYLKEHMLLHDSIKPYKCRYCDKTFVKLSNRKTHENTHTGKKPFSCNQCTLKFASSNGLRCHKECHHSGVKKYACDICGKGFYRNDYLREHIKSHMSDKPFKCGECSKSFKHAHNLKIHQRKHTGEKPYECNICKKLFTNSTNLNTHKQSHNKYKFLGIIDET